MFMHSAFRIKMTMGAFRHCPPGANIFLPFSLAFALRATAGRPWPGPGPIPVEAVEGRGIIAVSMLNTHEVTL